MVLIKKTIKVEEKVWLFFNKQPRFNFSGLVRELLEAEYLKQTKGKKTRGK